MAQELEIVDGEFEKFSDQLVGQSGLLDCTGSVESCGNVVRGNGFSALNSKKVLTRVRQKIQDRSESCKKRGDRLSNNFYGIAKEFCTQESDVSGKLDQASSFRVSYSTHISDRLGGNS